MAMQEVPPIKEEIRRVMPDSLESARAKYGHSNHALIPYMAKCISSKTWNEKGLDTYLIKMFKSSEFFQPIELAHDSESELNTNQITGVISHYIDKFIDTLRDSIIEICCDCSNVQGHAHDIIVCTKASIDVYLQSLQGSRGRLNSIHTDYIARTERTQRIKATVSDMDLIVEVMEEIFDSWCGNCIH